MVGGYRREFAGTRRCRVLALGLAAAVAWTVAALPARAADADQEAFDSPERAADVLVAAARTDDTAALVHVLGPAGAKLVNSGDPVADASGRDMSRAELQAAPAEEVP